MCKDLCLVMTIPSAVEMGPMSVTSHSWDKCPTGSCFVPSAFLPVNGSGCNRFGVSDLGWWGLEPVCWAYACLLNYRELCRITCVWVVERVSSTQATIFFWTVSPLVSLSIYLLFSVISVMISCISFIIIITQWSTMIQRILGCLLNNHVSIGIHLGELTHIIYSSVWVLTDPCDQSGLVKVNHMICGQGYFLEYLWSETHISSGG